MSGYIQVKQSTFRKGAILLYAFFLSLIAYIFAPQLFTPEPGEKSLRCTTAQLYVGLARAAGQNCTTKCTNWEAADCGGFSSCYNKNISCTNGIDQDGRPCKGCCYDCEVVCEPDPDKPPSISGSVSCGQWGNNGWCISSAVLNLNASDPQGYSLSITGNAKGNPISCNGSCSINLPSGSGVANYVVTASKSGLTASGSAGWDYDPDSPNIGLDINGSSGRNGWYISQVTVTPTGSDSISGLEGAFVSVNSGGWQTSATLKDGVHQVSVTASDKAGNIVNSSTTISVDTTTPSISVSIKGKASKNRWYASSPTISASTSDATSGVASLEVSIDGNSFQSYSSPISFSDGRHSIQFRATDKAGNSTETPTQEILIDSNAPSATLSTYDLPDGNVTYTAQDGESGIATIYITIEDKDGKYPKVKWTEDVSGKNVNGEHKWDGTLPGGIVAPAGEYLVWVKAVDQAGNQGTQAGNISIPESDSLFALSTSDTPQADAPADLLEASETDDENDSPDLTYGGSTVESTDTVSQSLTLSASASFTPNNPYPWWLVAGATAAAGATTYVAAKSVVAKQQKSRAQKQATRARLLAELEAKWEAEARIIESRRGKGITKKADRLEYEDAIRIEMNKLAKRQLAAQEKQKKKAQETQAGLAAYYNARKQAEKQAEESAPPKQKSWWEKTVDYIDQHQVEIALGFGAVVGLAAIALSGGIAAPMVAAAWVAGAAAVAGGTVALGTIGLNAYYGREWNENLGRNFALAGIAAAAVSGAWFLLQGASAGVGAYCAANPAICGRIEPVLNALDTVEEIGLNLKLGYQTWVGDPNAADTALEIQMEHMDGGMPGNSVARQIADLGDDAAELISLYGDDAIPLLLKYGDDAIDVIGAYGDEGIKLLTMYGQDAAKLIKEYGNDAIKLINKHGNNAFHALDGGLITLKINNVDEFADDLANATGHKVWVSTDTGVIYISKSTGDALDVSKELKKAIESGDKDKIAAIIKIIAKGSTRGSGNRLVLGAWHEKGGYIQDAVENGGVFFDTGDSIWKEIDRSGIDPWLINEEFLRNQLESGVDRIDFVGENIFDVINNPNPKISNSYRSKEIDWLLNNAGDYGYELIGNSWVRIKP